MPVDRSRSTVARASSRQTMVNYISGGRGGPGGDGHGSGTGGAGGDGMGPAFNFDISARNFTMNNLQQDPDKGIEILQRSVALAAIHDSAESYPQPRCHPETRTRMLENLRDWALYENAQHSILWLHGPAGAGKSAIMQTLCGDLEATGTFGGSFFFKRGHATRGNAKTLFATIAYQLALAVPCLRNPISQIVEKDPSVVVRSIATQMKTLISGPCRTHSNRHSMIVLIDGLDECEENGVQQEILRVIQVPGPEYLAPLRFIIASRPEPHIHEMFDSPVYAGKYFSFNVEKSFDDVRKYLRDEFSRIHRDHCTMRSVPSPWPSLDLLQDLVHKSSGHFIYAATIIKFIDDKDYRPTQRLRLVQDGNGTGSELAFNALDQLYMTILGSARRQAELIPILCATANFEVTGIEIDQLFEFPAGEAQLVLRGLHSVLHVTSSDIIFAHHASFVDFLNNQSRSHSFYVGSSDSRMHLARCFLRICAGPDRLLDCPRYPDGLSRRPHSHLIPFLTSLAPCVELCALIARMETDCIFALDHGKFGKMLSWLKTVPSASEELIELWEDNVYLASVKHKKQDGWLVKHIDLPSSELCQVLVAGKFLPYGLQGVRRVLDITWAELRTIICSVRPKSIGDEQLLYGSAEDVIQKLVPPETQPWICRDIALKFIRRIMESHVDDEAVWYDLARVLRVCPPCDVLHREFQSIPRHRMKSGISGRPIRIKWVLEWLESFGDSMLELVIFWRQEMLPEIDPGTLAKINRWAGGEFQRGQTLPLSSVEP
ncbi:hypothetical protein C8R45DRAFT_385828 [Mycena sanguinolenta]|nr:hypothetical protein C8R45DRAFT_385828 [Mycena sanguinolenta]